MAAQKALLVIDMLVDFMEERGTLYCGEEARRIIPFVREKLEQARKERWPVLFICDRHLPDDREFHLFPRHCVAGEVGAEIIAELTPQPGERVIHKRRYSGFFGTDLDLHLGELGIEELYLVGVCTNICVLYTAADARMRGYPVHVFREGVASFDQEAHCFALQEMEKTLGVEVE